MPLRFIFLEAESSYQGHAVHIADQKAASRVVFGSTVSFQSSCRVREGFLTSAMFHERESERERERDGGGGRKEGERETERERSNWIRILSVLFGWGISLAIISSLPWQSAGERQDLTLSPHQAQKCKPAIHSHRAAI